MKTLIIYWGLCLLLMAGMGKLYATDIRYENFVYEENIRTVRLFPGQFENNYPFISLQNQQSLTLIFDETVAHESPQSRFNLTFIHCDADWTPSSLLPMEFYEGFADQMITDYDYSVNTTIPYLHYEYVFPQEGERFKVSGNYVLLVYRDGDKNQPVLTRRFVIYENKMEVLPILTLSANLPRMRFQNLDFRVINKEGFQIMNPGMDLKVCVLQNGRWDNMLKDIQPFMYQTNNYEYRNNINTTFNAGNEFRRIDISSINLYGRSIETVTEDPYGQWHFYVRKDVEKNDNPPAPLNDYNGGYLVSVLEWPDQLLQPDYVHCHFTLKTRELYSSDRIFVTGAFCDWQKLPANEMKYNEGLRQYEGEILLKQGTYDYHYEAVDRKTKTVDESLIEGKRSDSENNYTILIYFKMMGERAYRLVGYKAWNY